jgi:hypothetical protein
MNSQDLHNLQEAYMDVYSEGYKPPRGKMTKRIAHKMFKGVNTLKTAHDSGEDLAGRTTGGQIASQKSEKLAKQAQKIYQTAKRHDPESSQRRERENRTVGQIAKGDPVSAKVLRDRYKKRGLPFKSKNNTTMKAIRDGLIDGVNDALGEEVNIYDIILSHLLDEGYAETQEQAEVIMVNMSEDWRESICEGLKPRPEEKMQNKIRKNAQRWMKMHDIELGMPHARRLVDRNDKIRNNLFTPNSDRDAVYNKHRPEEGKRSKFISDNNAKKK